MKRFMLVVIAAALTLAGSLGAQEADQIKVEELAKTTTSWDGRAIPAYPEGQPQVTVSKVTIPSGLKLQWHKHPVLTAGVVLKGQLTVITDKDERLHLKAGESIVEVINKWHHGVNEGDEPTEIIVFYAGIEGQPVTVLKPEQ